MNDVPTNSFHQRARRADFRDSFVLVAMSLVAVAVGVGLYAHFEAGFFQAVIAACIGYVAFLSVHLQFVRTQKVLHLEKEVAHLSARVMELQLEAAQRRDKAFDLEPPPVRRFVRATRQARNAEETRATDGVASSSRGPSLPPPPAPAVSIAGYPSLLSGNSMALDAKESNASADLSPRLESTSAPSPALKSTDAYVKLVVSTVDVATSEMVLVSSSEISGEPVSEQLPAEALGSGPTLSANSADTREFASMQVLIRQLAEQLNAPDHEIKASETNTSDDLSSSEDDVQTAESSTSESLGVSPAAVADQAIEQSASLLRSAAADLRRIDESGRLRESAVQPPAAMPQAPLAAVPPSLTEPYRPPSPYERLTLIAEAVEAERIDVYLEPIMGLDERKAKHFEVSVRLRTGDDRVFEAHDFRSIAAEAGLMAQIDSAKLARTAKVAERLRARGSTGALFSSFDGGSLGDGKFRDTYVGLFDGGGAPEGRLVLAFAQSDVRAFSRAHWAEIATMSALGLRFSVEEVTDLDMDFEQVVANGFEFIKLDAKVFLEGLPAPGKPIPAPDICRYLAGMGLTLVVGRIADESECAKIVEYGAVLGQGTLFGEARPVKVDMVGSQAAA